MNKVAKVEQTTGQDESLEQVEQRFARWRESRTPGQRIPPDLWAAAAGVAKAYGVHRTSRELRLDYNGLKKHMGPVVPTTRRARIDTEFVEWLGAASGVSVGECRVEMENARGAKMRVELNAGGLDALPGLCRAFWGAR
jgi:hypothetical protein